MSTISSVVVSRYKAYTRDSFVVKHIAFFLCTTNLEAVSVLFLLMCIYPLTPRPHPNLHIQLLRFLLPRLQRPRLGIQTVAAAATRTSSSKRKDALAASIGPISSRSADMISGRPGRGVKVGFLSSQRNACHLGLYEYWHPAGQETAVSQLDEERC